MRAERRHGRGRGRLTRDDYPLYTNVVQAYYRADHQFVGFPSRYVERKAWTPTFDQLASRERRLERILKTWPAEIEVMESGVPLLLQTFLVRRDPAGFASARACTTAPASARSIFLLSPGKSPNTCRLGRIGCTRLRGG